MKSNTETAICIECGKKFLKRKIGQISGGGMRIKSVRGAHTKTCSRKCSKKRSDRGRYKQVSNRTKDVK